ncbi:MAG: RNA 2',3'-cyclic phosphodiesterase [Ekhidna sp.]
MSEALYFIAIVPPQEIQEEITQLKMEVAEKYESNHALKSPPHITLHMPFKWKDRKYEALQEVIQSNNAQLKPFTIQLQNFNFFEPRVVFVDVRANEELDKLQKGVVDSCRKQLKLDNANYQNRPFHPHVTIGFRDLKKPMFYEARKEFEQRRINFDFEVRRIDLLKHDGSKWNIIGL